MGKNVEESIGSAASQIANDIEADTIIVVDKKKTEEFEEDKSAIDVSVTIFKKTKKGTYTKTQYNTKARRMESGSIVPIKEILMEAILRRYIDKGERVVCVQDESMGTGYKGMLFVFDVDKVFFNMSTHKLGEIVSPDVVEAVIAIAAEIGKEGREGKSVGTLFIVGDKRELLRYVRQLILNPFAGHPESLRKVTDPGIKETIKEFAQLDGAFIIDKDGLVVTTGAYIDIDTRDVELPKGFGTKHAVAAALTKATDAIAVVVSESGGVVRVFKNGEIVMRL